MSAPHALPVLADNRTGLLPPCQATQLTPRAQLPQELVLPGAWGPADSGTPAPPIFPAPTGGKDLCCSWLACSQGQCWTDSPCVKGEGRPVHTGTVRSGPSARGINSCFGNAVRDLGAARAGPPVPFPFPAHPNSSWWGIIILLLPDCCAPHHRNEPCSLKTKQTKPHLLDGLKKSAWGAGRP